MVEILRHPTEEDWKRCKLLALTTMGKRYVKTMPTDEWKYRILRSPHSPKRTLMFTIRMQVPYFVSVHFVRHKIGVEHYVQSQRNDRQDRYDRNDAPQSAMVTHVMDMNADALIQMAHMRLCGKAASETREVMRDICRKVIEVNPEFEPFLVPQCVWHGGLCHEFEPCGFLVRELLPNNQT